jgi:drug/metabolite transporter (DMT)-like permease
MYLTPPTTALMAWFLFDEPITWLIGFGIALTMGAVLMVNKASLHR